MAIFDPRVWLASIALWVIIILGACSYAGAQTVQQSGTVTPNHSTRWISNGVIGDAGTAADSPITSFGVTSNSGAGFCLSSGRSTAAGRQQLCFGAPLDSSAIISIQNYGTATAQNLTFRLNGTDLILPSGGGTFLTATGTLTAGHLLKFFNGSGVVEDAGVSISTGTQYGLPYYSMASAIGSTGAGTNGQFLIGQTSSVPLWRTLSGDVGSVSTAGVLTLQSVNGVTFNPTYTAHGVLLGNGTAAFGSSITSNTGYCLLSQGLSADPIWAACASGAGSAGGSNTQVQFNSSSSLAGSANLTWVSPALTVGVASSTSGQVAFASSGGGTVTVQAAAGVSATFNFNLPNSAGSSGQPLISGGGGSSVMTFGTLGIFGGGTNCAAASGTCLDNITGFSSTGYVRRSGAGSYAFDATIPVSGGGTGLAVGTSGGILGFTAGGTLASSALLTQNGVVVGGGAGATPTATAAGTNGQVLLGQTSAAPSFTTLSGDISAVAAGGSVTIANSAISNAKLANSAAYTLKGNFTGVSAAPQDSTIGGLTQKASPAGTDFILLQDQAASGQLKYATVSSVASAGSVSSLNSQTGAITFQAGVTNSSTTFFLEGKYASLNSGFNCSLAGSVSGNNLTVALKDADGNDPSASSPCLINFRSATAATGSQTLLTVTAATSVVLNSGSSLGSSSGNVGFRVWVVGFNDAGTFRLGVMNASTYTASAATIYPLAEYGVSNSTTCSACGTATAAGTFYTTAGVTAKAFRVIGYLEWGAGLTTAGTWASGPTVIQSFGHGVRLPGQVVQTVLTTSTTQTDTSSATFQNTAVSATVVPTSAVNFIKYNGQGVIYSTSGGTQVVIQVHRGATAVGSTANTVTTANGFPASVTGYDGPNTTSSTTYLIKVKSTNGAASVSFPYYTSPVNTGNGGQMLLEEIQG